MSSWDQREASVKGGCTHEKTGVRPRYTASWPGRHLYRHDFPVHIDLYKRWYLAHRIPRSDAPLPFLFSDPSRLSIPPPFTFLLPTGGCLPPTKFQIVESHPLLHFDPRTVPTRYTPRLERILPLEIRSLLLHARVPVDESSTTSLPPPRSSTIPSCPARRRTVYAVRGGSVTTGWRIWRMNERRNARIRYEHTGDQVQQT